MRVQKKRTNLELHHDIDKKLCMRVAVAPLKNKEEMPSLDNDVEKSDGRSTTTMEANVSSKLVIKSMES
jgi:hypothetical protein